MSDIEKLKKEVSTLRQRLDYIEADRRLEKNLCIDRDRSRGGSFGDAVASILS